MIIVRIWGGLGNQMFQYAMGYVMAKQNETDLLIDTEFYTNCNLPRYLTKREYGMSRFNIVGNDVNINSQFKILQKPIISKILRIFPRFSIMIKGMLYVKETRFRYLPYVLSYKNKNIYLDGYWQAYGYFEKYKKEITNMYSFENDVILDEYKRIANSEHNLVAVHIRRGDYVTANNPNVRNEEYYRSAIEIVSNVVKRPKFCFFSDDIEYVISTFRNIPNMCIANMNRVLNDVEELQLMRLCAHQIISNSSYSWWAAWLNSNPSKVVVCPAKWKGKSDMMPEAWIRC